MALIAVVGIIVGILGFPGTPARAAGSLPCDIYASNGTPCVAAHSTTRALLSSYNGRLYQVQRRSDGATTDIGTLTAGGYANSAAQDSFCSGSTCIITKIYDQSGRGNDLSIEGPGGNGGQDVGANAAALPVMAGGHRVYGLYVSDGVGYRNDSTSGVATNGAPEGMYMVTSGTHVNSGCCFDYGNAETSNTDTGSGHMDAVNFGIECWFSSCSGNGPWVQADLENGLFGGGNGSNLNNLGNSSPFVTALLKNNGQNRYAIKGGNAQSGSLSTWYDGAEPNLGGYSPMHQEGAIVLGTGGDNSNGSIGDFYEGVMTAGFPSDAADNAVQANIVSVGYSKINSGFPVLGTKYRIFNHNSGTVLDDLGCATSNGTAVDLYPSLGNACQQWTFSDAGNGTYYIVNVNSGLYLDLSGSNCGVNNGTLVDQWSFRGDFCEGWSVVPTSDGHYEIIAKFIGRALEDKYCITSNYAKVGIWQWLNNSCQEWSIAP